MRQQDFAVAKLNNQIEVCYLIRIYLAKFYIIIVFIKFRIFLSFSFFHFFYIYNNFLQALENRMKIALQAELDTKTKCEQLDKEFKAKEVWRELCSVEDSIFFPLLSLFFF
jgi:hypothetical protein